MVVTLNDEGKGCDSSAARLISPVWLHQRGTWEAGHCLDRKKRGAYAGGGVWEARLVQQLLELRHAEGGEAGRLRGGGAAVLRGPQERVLQQLLGTV